MKTLIELNPRDADLQHPYKYKVVTTSKELPSHQMVSYFISLEQATAFAKKLKRK